MESSLNWMQLSVGRDVRTNKKISYDKLIHYSHRISKSGHRERLIETEMTKSRIDR